MLHVAAPARFGGLEAVVGDLAAGFVEKGHDARVVSVLTPGEENEHPFLASLRDREVRTHELVIPPRAYLRERRSVRRLCRSVRPDIVHTHGYRPDVVDGGVARALGIPVVTTVHGFTRGKGRGTVYEWLQRRAFRRFDAVIAVSERQVGELEAAGVGRDRIHLIPNAWDGAAEFADAAAARAALGVPSDVWHIGWVGRLSREKGPDVFVDALSRLDGVRFVASIVGDGRERESLEARVGEAGLGDRVRWHGRVENARRWFRAFDAFVLSSRTEGTPIVLFEAMAAGVPVVATRVGGVPGVVGPGEALLVPSEDPEALAGALQALHAGSVAARQRVDRAERRLRTNFARTPWLARHESIYRGLIDPRRFSME